MSKIPLFLSKRLRLFSNDVDSMTVLLQVPKGAKECGPLV